MQVTFYLKAKKSLVNKTMNIESVTNSIEHVGVKKVTKKGFFRKAKKDSEIEKERSLFEDCCFRWK